MFALVCCINNIISCACFTMTGNGPSPAEFPVILKQSNDILATFEGLLCRWQTQLCMGQSKREGKWWSVEVGDSRGEEGISKKRRVMYV